MVDKVKVEQAIRLFEGFSGHNATVAAETFIPEDDTLVVVGECEAIAYNATRDGVTESYQHEFKEGSRPVLATSHDGRRLYLLAGAFEFTHRGIEDR